MDGLIPVTFRFPAVLTPEAQRVSLIGPFNSWTPNAHPLARAGDYWWIITLYFPPGRRIAYCFDVDGVAWFGSLSCLRLSVDERQVPCGVGAHFNDAVRTPLVPRAVAAALDILEQPRQPLIETLGQHLRSARPRPGQSGDNDGGSLRPRSGYMSISSGL